MVLLVILKGGKVGFVVIMMVWWEIWEKVGNNGMAIVNSIFKVSNR